MRHMWTAPSLQDLADNIDRIACVHMSGLWVRSHMNAGQDGFRDTSSKQGCDLQRPLAHTGYHASRIDRSTICCFLQVHASVQDGSSDCPLTIAA